MNRLHLLALALVLTGVVGLIFASKAKIELWGGTWRDRSWLDKYVDWMEEKGRTPEERRLLRFYWAGTAAGYLSFLLALLAYAAS